MTPLLRAIAIAGHIALLTVGAGLIVRRRWRLSAFFSAYVAFGLVVNPLFVWWPSHFHSRWFYLAVQTVADILKFGIGLELAWRTFRPFPGARSWALPTALIVLAATALAAAAVPIGANAEAWEVVVGEFFPRVKAGTIWLMAVTLVLAHWFHVPVHRFHAALLTSFVSYLGVSSAMLWLTEGGGGGAFGVDRDLVDTIHAGADLVMAGFWARTAWRPDTASDIAHWETVRRLQTATALLGDAR
jgi:hypothetical protein